MILGIGVDVIQITRMKGILDRWGDKFVNRVFTDQEIDYCLDKREPAAHFTVRFAAKEAVMKALSQGNGHAPLILKDIEVVRAQNGRPGIKLHGRACEAANSLQVRRILVSLTHSADIAAAQVVLEGDTELHVDPDTKPC